MAVRDGLQLVILTLLDGRVDRSLSRTSDRFGRSEAAEDGQSQTRLELHVEDCLEEVEKSLGER